jgi:hypothetical protein
VANAAPILLGRICDEYVCAAIALLRGALESSACSRKWNKVHVVGNDNQDIRIFRVKFPGREGADYPSPREHLLRAVLQFVKVVRAMPGVTRIALTARSGT